MVKFSSQMDASLLEQLRALAKESGRSLSSVLGEAVGAYLERERVRPAFVDASRRVLETHQELLKRLAK